MTPHIAVALWKAPRRTIRGEVRTYSGLTVREYWKAISASWRVSQ